MADLNSNFTEMLSDYNWKGAEIPLYADRDIGIKDWSGSFHNSGIQAWRITESDVEEWKLAAAGKFFSQEVYIVLNCGKLKTSTSYDIHCWIGKQASSDLYKKALYNAVALSDAMEGRALVHREVQDFESKRFTNYFDALTVLKGGSDEMANCDLHSKYKTRLLRLTGPTAGGNICVRETALKRGALDSNGVFIIDTGIKIYQWNGMFNKDRKKAERANEYARLLQAERGTSGITVVTVDESERTKTHSVYEVFPPQAKKRKPSRQETIAQSIGPLQKKKMMFTVSLNPQLEFKKVAEGADLCSRRMNSEEVTLVDVRFGKMDADDHLFVRIGDEWPGDQDSGLIYGHHYLRQCPEVDQHPTIAITVVKEGQLSTQLNGAISS